MDKNPEKIKQMFNEIANSYDFNNNVISFGLHKFVKKLAITSFKFKGKCLDLCTGTGDIAFLLKRCGCEVIGLDFSSKMLEIARKKHSNIEFTEGDCTHLPFDSNSFDNITISFGLRNIENYDKALDEIFRVLKPNGKFFHLDFGKENFLANILYDFVMPKLVRIFYGNDLPYKYLVQSKKVFFDNKKLTELFQHHGFKLIEKKSFLFGTISCQLCEKV
ncbi:ubiquinone/menaquinone biosynthesis methyltransferase [bacterium]|nr:ubiquinone/menaquinone biosynthesis methyltransferase [bacterium]